MTWYRATGGIPQSVKNLKTPTSLSGAGVSFNTDLTDNLIKCIADINAVQSGSGTPSPSNPRSISGHTDCVITANSIPVTVALGQTVYGGYLNVLSGKLTITSKYVELDGSIDENWFVVSGTSKFYCAYPDIAEIYITGDYSNLYDFGGQAGSSASVVDDMTFYTQRNENQPQYNRFWIYDSSYSTVEDLRTGLGNQPMQIVCPLREDYYITVQLNSNQISTISGQNTISADTGDVDITYLETVGHKIS